MGDIAGPRILVVEDDERVTSFLHEALELEGYAVESFSRAEDALAGIRSGTEYHVALVDVLLSGMDGLAFTRTVCSLLPDMFVIVMTGYGTGDLAAQAIRMGAYDYLPKPFDADRVLQTVRNALRDRAERLRNISMAYAPLDADVILGESAEMREIFKAIGRLASTWSNVVVRGEPGSGRSLVARAVHRFSQQGRGPFIRMDCSAYDASSARIILFGGETDDVGSGRLAQALGGTLVLRRADLLPHELQNRLLGIISDDTSAENLRIISILPEPGVELDIVPELLLSLRVMEISIPPLRSRRDDIPVLTDYFRRYFNSKLGKSVPYFTEEAMAALMQYHWPGNIRDLRNAVESAITNSAKQIPGLADFPAEIATAAKTAGQNKQGPCDALFKQLFAEAAGRRHPLESVTKKLKRMAARYGLDAAGGNVTDAAKQMGVSRQTLRRLI
ncbi:MAG: sigma-54-dependent Fis family transcriptional regulator [Planctomycetes bacterium]|nr:sigma-54-dependent Fis family transcriptional regulator [Planctomycetota bacterium]